MLSNLGQSPNVGAALIVSLGCEGTDHERMVEEIRACGKPVDIIRIQELGGTSRAIQAGIDAAQRMVMEISSCQREEVDASEIMMSIKCGASDATSGLASNAVIGTWLISWSTSAGRLSSAKRRNSSAANISWQTAPSAGRTVP